jgi:hypothetical protein
MNPRVVIGLQVAGVLFCLAAISGSFVMSFDTWVAIGQLAGFGALAVAMPLCVDGHVMTALTTWLSPVSERLAAFARINLYVVGAASVLAQSSYHGIVTWQQTHDEARTLLSVGAGAFPPIVATLAVHLAVGIVREALAKSPAATVADRSDEPSRSPELSSPAAQTTPSLTSPAREPSRLAAAPAPSPSLSAVPPASSDRPAARQRVLETTGLSHLDDRPSPSSRVTVEDVARLAHLERAEIARQLNTSVATVDRRLKTIRQAVAS